MHKVELHRVMSVCDEFIRWSNKWWADGIKAAEASEDADARRQVLVDSFYLLRVATACSCIPLCPSAARRSATT